MSDTAASGATAAAPAAQPAPGRWPEFAASAFLVGLGVLVLTSAFRLSDNRSGVDPLGPRPMPILVGSLLIVLALTLAVAVARGARAEAEAGEDVDLAQPIDAKTVLALLAVFVADIVLIDWLGWVLSGGLLFYGCAIALGSRHFVRDLAISAALSLSTFYGFAIGLGVNLPAGILQGIL